MKYRYYSNIPYGNMYKKPTARNEYQVFSEDYFSGADVNIFFGKIWVDEIVELSFSMQEQVLPIYGYNSYTYDAMARGRRIVQGQFTINFKSSGYLQEILKNAMPIENEINETLSKLKISAKDVRKYKLDDILKEQGKKSFNETSTAMQDAIWGVEGSDESLLNSGYESYFPNVNYGFDIQINYGPVNEYMSTKKAIKKLNEKHSMNHNPNLTVETINGVQITSFTRSGIQTGSDGRPITETYQFLARDINGPLLF